MIGDFDLLIWWKGNATNFSNMRKYLKSYIANNSFSNGSSLLYFFNCVRIRIVWYEHGYLKFVFPCYDITWEFFVYWVQSSRLYVNILGNF